MIDVALGGRFRTTRLLGTGGMGSVYEAVDEVTGQRVAVKIVTAEVAGNETLKGRFEREARAAMALDTPHIVRLFDAGTDRASGLPFLVMELLEGEDGQELIKRVGPLRPDLALRIVAQACLGLGKAHELRIVHRDIKPANLFLSRGREGERVVKVLDFGIAKFARDPNEKHAETAGLTRTGSLLGSPLYMAPEQARGHKSIDHRADIWSLGVVLYQALSGRTPYQDCDTVGDLIIAICTESPEPVQNIAPWVPPEVAAIVHGALRIEPLERFQSAAEMLGAIRSIIGERSSITEAMLTQLSDAERGCVAPRLTATAADALLPRGEPSRAEGSKNVSEAPEPLSFAAFGKTTGERPIAKPPSAGRGRVALIAAGAVVATAIGGAAAFALLRAAPDSQAAQQGALAHASPTLATSAASAEAAAAPAPDRRVVRVVVIPADAEVEIDGARAAPSEGVVEIAGALGSVHRVVVRANGASLTREVVVTDSGALPPKIEVEKAAEPAERTGLVKPGKVSNPALPKAPSSASPAPRKAPDIFISR